MSETRGASFITPRSIENLGESHAAHNSPTRSAPPYVVSVHDVRQPRLSGLLNDRWTVFAADARMGLAPPSKRISGRSNRPSGPAGPRFSPSIIAAWCNGEHLASMRRGSG